MAQLTSMIAEPTSPSTEHPLRQPLITLIRQNAPAAAARADQVAAIKAEIISDVRGMLADHGKDANAHEPAFGRHDALPGAHAPAFAGHNADEKAHQVIQRNGLFSMFSAEQLAKLDNDQLRSALEDLHKVQQAYQAKSAQATAILGERGVATAGAMGRVMLGTDGAAAAAH
jgi:hypothetical protein